MGDSEADCSWIGLDRLLSETLKLKIPEFTKYTWTGAVASFTRDSGLLSKVSILYYITPCITNTVTLFAELDEVDHYKSKKVSLALEKLLFSVLVYFLF